MTYAEKVWKDAEREWTWEAARTNDESADKKAAAIISAAPKRQREGCQEELENQLAGILLTHPWMKFPNVLNAEVDAPTDTKPIPSGEE